MFQIRRADDRGHFDHGWLDTRHTFSFGEYHDRRHMSGLWMFQVHGPLLADPRVRRFYERRGVLG